MEPIKLLKKETIQKGKGQFTFNQYSPLANQPVKVFYYAPQSDLTTLDIIIVMAGINRNADEYRDYWIDVANEYGLLVIAPKFSKELYPDARSYNLGNIFDENENLLPEDEWSFSLIDSLFNVVKNVTENIHPKYYLFGHSAGSQFVHRFMIFKPFNKVKMAIAANAGWYTLPDININFPYGLKNSPIPSLATTTIFDQKLVILLGEDDNNSNSSNLRHTLEADLQGLNRFDRGHYFYEKSKTNAANLGLPFQWQLSTVPNVDHDAAQMSVEAAKYIFD